MYIHAILLEATIFVFPTKENLKGCLCCFVGFYIDSWVFNVFTKRDKGCCAVWVPDDQES